MIPLNRFSTNLNYLETAKINFSELIVARLSAFFSVAPTAQHHEIYPPGTFHVRQVARPSNQTCLVCLMNQNWHASDASDWNWPIPDWQKHCYGMSSECRNSLFPMTSDFQLKNDDATFATIIRQWSLGEFNWTDFEMLCNILKGRWAIQRTVRQSATWKLPS